jgi:hypothetical protein
MKTKLVILLISVIPIGLLSSCNCYSCLAGGESFDLPYSNNQTVSFIDDSGEKISYSSQTTERLPQSEFCGSVGSESYGDCYGVSTASLKNKKDSSILITIKYSTDYGDGVEQHINKIISVIKSTISISQGVGSTSDKNGIVKLLENITINGGQYKNVYVYQNDSAAINNCSYFVYGVKDGILKYSIKREYSSENWIMSK